MSEISILLKNPAAHGADFLLKTASTNTVCQLKEQINASHPNTPSMSSQKLIFAGKLLKDEELLRTVFAQQDLTALQVVHLVLTEKLDTSSSTQFDSCSSSTHLGSSSSSSSTHVDSSTSDAHAANSAAPSQPQANATSTSFQPYGYPPMFPPVLPQMDPQNLAGFSPEVLAQQLAMQQYWQQQYMAQFVQMQGQAQTSQASSVPPLTPQQLQQQQERQQRQQQVVAQMGGEGLEGDAPQEGDRFGQFKLIMKLAVAILLLGQNASSGRLLTLCLIGLFVFMFQAGFFHFSIPLPAVGSPIQSGPPQIPTTFLHRVFWELYVLFGGFLVSMVPLST